MSGLDDLMARAFAASRATAEARTAALEASVHAMQALFAAVQQALGTEALRGMPTLTEKLLNGTVDGQHVAGPLYAARVHGREPWGPLDERDRLVLMRDLRLARARIAYDRWEATTVPLETVVVQDVPSVFAAIQGALERHIARSERTSESYTRTAQLCERLAQTLGWDG